jgi:hypothetical protein
MIRIEHKGLAPTHGALPPVVLLSLLLLAA